MHRFIQPHRVPFCSTFHNMRMCHLELLFQPNILAGEVTKVIGSQQIKACNIFFFLIKTLLRPWNFSTDLIKSSYVTATATSNRGIRRRYESRYRVGGSLLASTPRPSDAGNFRNYADGVAGRVVVGG